MSLQPIFNRELREAGVRKVRHTAPGGARASGADLLRLFDEELLGLGRVEELTDAPDDAADPAGAGE